MKAYTIVVSNPSSYLRIPADAASILRADELLLYAALVERTFLSIRTNVKTAKPTYASSLGVFCRFSRTEAMSLLHCAQQKSTKLYQSLCEKGLLDMERSDGELHVKKTGDLLQNSDPYFHNGDSSLMFTHWRLPRELFSDEYASLPGGAKLIFSYLHTSAQQGSVKVTVSQLQSIFGYDRKSISKYLSLLEEIQLLSPSVETEHTQPKEKPFLNREIWTTVANQIGDYSSYYGMPYDESTVVENVMDFAYDVYAGRTKRKRIGGTFYSHPELLDIVRQLTPLHVGAIMEAYVTYKGTITNDAAYIKKLIISAVEDKLFKQFPITSHSKALHPDRYILSLPSSPRRNTSGLINPEYRPSKADYQRLIE